MDMLDIITEAMLKGIRSREERRKYVAMIACTHCKGKVYMPSLRKQFVCPYCNKSNG